MVKRIASIVLVGIISLTLLGCTQQTAPEKTTVEQLEEYLNSPEISKFSEEVFDDLTIMNQAAGEGDFQQAVETNAVIATMCDEVIDYEPGSKITELHDCDSKIAEAAKACSDYYCDAASCAQLKDVVGANNNAQKASDEIEKLSSYVDERAEIASSLRSSTE